LEGETARSNQVDDIGSFGDRAPLYSPRHSQRGPVRQVRDAGDIAGDTERIDSAGILSQRRSHDTDDSPPAVPIDAQRQSIPGCSTERRDEVDRIAARNPLIDKYGCGTREGLASIDHLRNADGGPRELRIPKRSSLVAKRELRNKAFLVITTLASVRAQQATPRQNIHFATQIFRPRHECNDYTTLAACKPRSACRGPGPNR
jgi:hypothetical protein